MGVKKKIEKKKKKVTKSVTPMTKIVKKVTKNGKCSNNTKSTHIKRTLKKERRKKTFLRLFPNKACNISETCKSINVDRKTYYKWIAADEDFKEKVDYIQESFIDMAESQLLKMITGYTDSYERAYREKGVLKTEIVNKRVSPDNTCLIFFLKTKGKERGYIESNKMDITSDDKPIQAGTQIIFVDSSKDDE